MVFKNFHQTVKLRANIWVQVRWWICSRLFCLSITGPLTYIIGISPVISSPLNCPPPRGLCWKGTAAFPFSNESAWCVAAVAPCSHMVSLLNTCLVQLWEPLLVGQRRSPLSHCQECLGMLCTQVLKLHYLPLPWQEQAMDSEPLPLPNLWGLSHWEMRQLSQGHFKHKRSCPLRLVEPVVSVSKLRDISWGRMITARGFTLSPIFA